MYTEYTRTHPEIEVSRDRKGSQDRKGPQDTKGPPVRLDCQAFQVYTCTYT